MTNKEMLQRANVEQLALWLANRISCLHCDMRGECDKEVYSKYNCIKLLKKFLKEET